MGKQCSVSMLPKNMAFQMARLFKGLSTAFTNIRPDNYGLSVTTCIVEPYSAVLSRSGKGHQHSMRLCDR